MNLHSLLILMLNLKRLDTKTIRWESLDLLQVNSVLESLCHLSGASYQRGGYPVSLGRWSQIEVRLLAGTGTSFPVSLLFD